MRAPRRARRLAGVALACLLGASACITSTTHSYLPDTSRDRMSLANAQDALDQFVSVECPRLREAKRDLSDGEVQVELDGTGNVTRSSVTHSLGDERMDKIYGGVAAQMHFDAPPDGKPTTGRMKVGYSCGPNATTATIQLM